MSLSLQTREAMIYGQPARPYWPTAILSYDVSTQLYRVELELVPVPSAPAGTTKLSIGSQTSSQPQIQVAVAGIFVKFNTSIFQMTWGNNYNASLSGQILQEFLDSVKTPESSHDYRSIYISLAVVGGLLLVIGFVYLLRRFRR